MKFFRLFFLCATFVTSFAIAQGEMPKGSVAVVNGKTISESYFAEQLSAAISQGLQNDKQLRVSLLNDLVSIELMAQDAITSKLDSTPEFKNQMDRVRQSLLAELAFLNFMKNNSITEVDLKSEYDAQVKSLGDTTHLKEYRLSQILLPNEIVAKDAIARLKKEPFSKVAIDMSIDKSKSVGGDMGWFLPNQLLPELFQAIINKNKGVVVEFPIKTQNGWHILKIEDKRSYKLPSYEESKDLLRKTLIQRKRNDYLEKLIKTSKISIKDLNEQQ